MWGPLCIDVVRLPCPVGVSPTYIPSIETEHAGGDDQIMRDPVLWDTIPVDVSVGKGERGGVAANVTPDVWAGVSGTVLVDNVAGSGGDE
jgi:hypothetical protein